MSGRVLRITHPDKVYFGARGDTKLTLIRYFVDVEEGVMRAVRQRPVVMHRFPGGASGGKSFFQKRIPKSAPEWVTALSVRFPSARPGRLLCPEELAHVIWAVGRGGFDLHPWPVKRSALDTPDELRVDLDPQPGCDFETVREVAHAIRALLGELGLEAFPKLSGSRGIHLHVPIEPRWSFTEVRDGCVALAREMERRLPKRVTAAWWKEQRGPRVFIDYNQNLRDKTLVAAYAVRPMANAPVACPLRWEEVDTADQADFTIATVPERLATLGDPFAAMEDSPRGQLDTLLDMYAADIAAGLEDAPWPPHYPKRRKSSDHPGEPKRVAPSRARRD